MHFTLHRQFPQGLRNDWDALLKQSTADVPFLRYDFLHQWWETRGGGEWQQAELNIITASNDSGLTGVAPFFKTLHNGQHCLMFLGSIEVFDYLDFVSRAEDLPGFLEGLVSYVGELDPLCNVIDLYNIINHSPTIPILQATASKLGWTFNLEPIQPSPYIPLTGDWETYLAGIDKKQRHEIRRKMRRFEEIGPGTRWYIADDPRKLDSEMDDFLNMMSQDLDKHVFLTPVMREFMHQIARVSMEAGILQLSFLEIEGEKAAAKFILNYQDRLLAYNSAVETRFREHSPGWVLLGYLLQWATENGIHEFDFMRGNEEYKYRFGARDRFVMRATLTR